MQQNIKTVKTIIDALPYIKDFSGQIFVVKYGGAAWENLALRKKFAEDIMLLHLVGIKIVIVHGGGKNITQLLEQLGVKTAFKDGLRVTDAQTLKIAEMVLKGDINSEIVSLLNAQGALAVGISGKDAGLVKARALDKDLGFVGEVAEINTRALDLILADNLIPVVAPIASGLAPSDPGFNINADTMAAEIAKKIRAKKVIFLTDTSGVLDGDGKLINSLSGARIADLKRRGVISGGMIPKIDASLDLIRSGVEKVHIIDARAEHSMLLEIFTKDGVGTQIVGA